MVSEPGEVVIWDILAIKCDGSGIDVNGLDPKDDYPKPEPMEQTKEIEISGNGRTTQIRTLLNHDQKGKMVRFLRENSYIFAWSAAKMPGIPPSIISHSLNVNPMVRPAK